MRVAVVCEDAGGARALAPVARSLHARGDEVALVLGEQARAAFQAPLGPYPFEVARSPADAIAGRAVLISASTCWGERLEAKAVLAAREHKIPTLTFVDFWSNYRARLSYPDDTNLALLPDRLAVVDRTMADDLVNVGAPADCIAVTGSPAFDGIVPTPLPHGSRAKTILFLSQPLASLYGNTLGYTEQATITVVARIARELSAQLRVRLHPREDRAAMAAFARSLDGDDVEIDDHETLADAIATSTLVVGMSSMGLVEAALLGRIAISAQLARAHEDDDALPTNRVGLTIGPVTTEQDLHGLIDRALRDPTPTPHASSFLPGATTRLVAVLDDLVRGGESTSKSKSKS